MSTAKPTTNLKAAKQRRTAPLQTTSDLGAEATRDLSAELNALLADTFALYLKTKNFHWHVSGRHFRDYHLMLDQQSDAIFATTDQLAERVRKRMTTSGAKTSGGKTKRMPARMA